MRAGLRGVGTDDVAGRPTHGRLPLSFSTACAAFGSAPRPTARRSRPSDPAVFEHVDGRVPVAGATWSGRVFPAQLFARHALKCRPAEYRRQRPAMLGRWSPTRADLGDDGRLTLVVLALSTSWCRCAFEQGGRRSLVSMAPYQHRAARSGGAPDIAGNSLELGICVR